MTTTSSCRRRSLGTAGVLAVSLTTLLAACGGGSAKAASAKTSTSSSASSPVASGSPTGAGRGTGGPGGGAFSGAVGSVAAITGSSMEVQNPSSGQTTVTWTGSTAFDQTVKLTAAALAPGDCATVTGSTSNGRITARSVAITKASSSGTCPTGFGPGGRGGFAARAGNGGSPTGSAPTGRAPGRVRAGLANVGFASGKVVSASANSLVLYGTSFAGGRSPRPSVPPTTAAPADVTVTLDPSTTYTQVRPAGAANLAVGDCVVATGPADSTGAVTARTIRITSTGGQSCSTGFGRFAGAGATPAGSVDSNA